MKQFIAIDLKSFYASVECVERGLDPLNTNLVVADESRTDKTICLAVSPSLKAHGISGRARLFEAKQRVREVNRDRRQRAPGRRFCGKSVFASRLDADPSLELDFITAAPRMAYYMDYSRRIVEIYLQYVSIDDILVYSIDEVFIDVTHYLSAYRMTAEALASAMIRRVLKETGITATAGVGANMYLAKVAMDIVAKHIPADGDGVRIARLDEMRYREMLWGHRPITDFWRVGPGIARRLAENGMFTMGDVARCSEGEAGSFFCEDLLYKLLGVNAELLIDHAWGWEETEIADCKAYRPRTKSLCSGQVLTSPYAAKKGRLVVAEMADLLSLDLVRHGFVTDQVVLDVGYDVENLKDPRRAAKYTGPVVADHYGRQVPKGVHGSKNLGEYTSSTRQIVEAVGEIYDRIVDGELTVRRFSISVNRLLTKEELREKQKENAGGGDQLSLFVDYGALERERETARLAREREERIQRALISIRDRYGKNAIVKGMNMEEGATAMERNKQIGGHKA